MATTSAVATSRPVFCAWARPFLLVCRTIFSSPEYFWLQSLIVLSKFAFSSPANEMHTYRNSESNNQFSTEILYHATYSSD